MLMDIAENPNLEKEVFKKTLKYFGFYVMVMLHKILVHKGCCVVDQQ